MSQLTLDADDNQHWQSTDADRNLKPIILASLSANQWLDVVGRDGLCPVAAASTPSTSSRVTSIISPMPRLHRVTACVSHSHPLHNAGTYIR